MGFVAGALMTIGALFDTNVRARASIDLDCSDYWITGYVAYALPGWTADGSTTTVGAIQRGERIVAASRNLPFDTQLIIEGLRGVYRVADRGYLGPRHIDVLVATYAEAYELTGTREVCVITNK